MGNIIVIAVRFIKLVALIIALSLLRQSATSQEGEDSEHTFRLRKLVSNLDSWYKVLGPKGNILGYQNINIEPSGKPDSATRFVFTKKEEVNHKGFEQWAIKKDIRAELDASWNIMSFAAEYSFNNYHFIADYNSARKMLVIRNSDSKKEIPVDDSTHGLFDINLALLMLAQKNARLTTYPFNTMLLITPRFISKKFELQLIENTVAYSGEEKITTNGEAMLTFLSEKETPDSPANIQSVNVDSYGRVVRMESFDGIIIRLETEFEWYPLTEQIESYYKILWNLKQIGHARTLIEPTADGFNYRYDLTTRHSFYDVVENAHTTIKATVKDNTVTDYNFYFRFGIRDIEIKYTNKENIIELLMNGVKTFEKNMTGTGKLYLEAQVGLLIDFQYNKLYKSSNTVFRSFPFALDVAAGLLTTGSFIDVPGIALTNYGWKQRKYFGKAVTTLELASNQGANTQVYIDKFGRILESRSQFPNGDELRSVIVKDEAEAMTGDRATIPPFVPSILKDPVTERQMPHSPMVLKHKQIEDMIEELRSQLESLKRETNQELILKKYNSFQENAREKLNYVDGLIRTDISYYKYSKIIQEFIEESTIIVPYKTSILLNCQSLYSLFLDSIDREDKTSVDKYYNTLKSILSSTQEIDDMEVRRKLTEINRNINRKYSEFMAYLQLRAINISVGGILIQNADRKSGKKKAVCIINNLTVSEGGELFLSNLQVKVKKITRFYVEIEYNGATKKYEVLQ